MKTHLTKNLSMNLIYSLQVRMFSPSQSSAMFFSHIFS